MVLLPAEATLPRPVEAPDDPGRKADTGRINREELYADVLDMAKLDGGFLLMVALSAVVASVGLMRDSPVIVLSVTLGDRELGRSGARTAAVGMILATGLAVILGMTFEIDSTKSEIVTRTSAGFGDLVLALAAGAAGALSILRGASMALIGVMVAVALLPPTVVTGMLLGSGRLRLALGAAELVAINLLCLVLAAIVVFVSHGIRPTAFWEAENAKRSTRRALVAGGLMLLALLVLIILRVQQRA